MVHKLLLADDSITIQRVIELTFAEEDVHVTAVGDGRQAIDRVQTDRPDIVLADVGMPERDGYEVAAFIKNNPQFAHIPVLLLTGAFEPIDETRARAVGCDGVLVKPFEPQMVINRVKDLLAGRRPAVSQSSPSGTPADVSAGPPSPPREAPPAASVQGDSLEDYFDRLDAAFATLGSEQAPSEAAPAATATAQSAASPAARPVAVEDISSWDPDLAGDPTRPAAHVAPAGIHQAPIAAPVSAPVAPVSVHVSVSAPPAVPVASPAPQTAAAPVVHSTPLPPALQSVASQVSLAEAFAALLTAEHGQTISLVTPTATSAPSPDVVEDIVRRVLDRLQDQGMRQTVVDVAERVVREEIDRIKRAAG